MTGRRSMTLGDWLNSAVNLIIGLLLGMATFGLAKLLNAGLWLSALLVILPFLALVAFVQLMDGLLERLFPTGVRPANAPAAQEPKPMTRRLSLPAGFGLGVIAGALGFSEPILGVL